MFQIYFVSEDVSTLQIKDAIEKTGAEKDSRWGSYRSQENMNG